VGVDHYIGISLATSLGVTLLGTAAISNQMCFISIC